MVSKANPPRLRFLAIAIAGALASCDGGRPDDPAVNKGAAASPRPQPAAPAPITVPALDRESLLLAIAHAASASGGGADDSAAQAELDGRQFSFRMRFGCNGGPASAAAGPTSWAYDGDKQTLRVVATPDITSASPPIAPLAGPEVEAVQGFWVRQPWLFAAACPMAESAAPQTVQPEVGLAQFFTAEESRVARRSRPFQAVQKVAPENAPGAQGLNLLLSGRLKKLPDGRVVKCLPADPDRRPVCVASVEFDRVAVENPDTGAVIAEWGVG